MKYRKTALIEATQWFKMGDHPSVKWWDGDQGEPSYSYIQTLEGQLAVTPGDWIAGPGAAGEFWPIKPDIFASTYEPAE